VDRVVAGPHRPGGQRVGGPVLADLDRVDRVGDVVHPQVAIAALNLWAGVLAEVLVGGEQQPTGVVVAGGVGIAVLVGA
jgi:hypothetical protein